MKKSLILLSVLILGIGANIHAVTLLTRPNTEIVQVDRRVDFLRSTLSYLGCPGHLTFPVEHGLKVAENRTGISAVLLACLIYTESSFRTDAISKKGYKGLLQTPTATTIPLIDINHGADILREKLHLTQWNYLEALTLYKGGRNKIARSQAKQVLVVYNYLIRWARTENKIG